ncbi:DUF222 domain-containing protein [Paenarthrobacter sp. NPDC058040]|uniref:HNH endonuclease signature motif containing protein n=1 Tax=unclassified Paenarthrobacter TaxID=2634190 RepID=UPI0036DDF5B2
MGVSGKVSGSRTDASGPVPAAGPRIDSGIVPGTTTAGAGSGEPSRSAGLLLDVDAVQETLPGTHTPGAASNETAAHALGNDAGPRRHGASGTTSGHLNEEIESALEDAAVVLGALRHASAPAARMFNIWDAADFAGRVEELSRGLEYLQIVAAHAVERTREEAKHAAPSRAKDSRAEDSGADAAATWRTGWTETGPIENEPTGNTTAARPASVLDDGFRDAAQFLRARLRIGIREARRRIAQATTLLPGTTLTGEPTPPRYEHLATALATTMVPSPSATIITTALDRAALIAHPHTLTAMEHALTHAATETDPDFITKLARRWNDRIDHDGPEPTEEELRTLQGAFIRKPRRGLHHIEIFATDEQYETLTTLMNTATNPRLTTNPDATQSTIWIPELDRRSRAQKLLDGLVGGCALALKTGKLPANGGLKPQLTVTISAQDLYTTLQPPGTNPGTGTSQTPTTPPLSTGTGTFTGPIHPETIRKIACDADILPVLLGTDGQILDIGRTSRIFPPHIRKALNARDQGCTFPDCTMPAPWCEAHHITYWSQGGPTSTNNAALLCSHHHHLIHKEQWKITIHNGTPWYTPPPHIDPTQTPRKNHHHTPHQPQAPA